MLLLNDLKNIILKTKDIISKIYIKDNRRFEKIKEIYRKNHSKKKKLTGAIAEIITKQIK